MDKLKYTKYDLKWGNYSLKDKSGPIDEKMVKSCLRWFGHGQRSKINVWMRKSELIQVEETKKCKGKQLITLIYRSSKKKKNVKLRK